MEKDKDFTRQQGFLWNENGRWSKKVAAVSRGRSLSRLVLALLFKILYMVFIFNSQLFLHGQPVRKQFPHPHFLAVKPVRQ